LRAETLFGKGRGIGEKDLDALAQVELDSDVAVSATVGVSVVELLIKADMATSKRYLFYENTKYD